MASRGSSRASATGAVATKSTEGAGERTDLSLPAPYLSTVSFQLLRYVDDVALLVTNSDQRAAVRAVTAEVHRWHDQAGRPWPSPARGLEHRTNSLPREDESTTAGSEASGGSDSERDRKGGADDH